MNIHEYQAKALLQQFAAPVPDGGVAFSADEAFSIAETLGGDTWVVKAQIHAGGRGKGGGVAVVKSLADVRAQAERMLAMTLITHQTGPAGKKVRRVYVEQGVSIDKEFYLSALIDRASSRLAFIASTEGGMDIEEVATKTPDKIKTITIDPATGLSGFHIRQIAFALGLKGDQIKQCGKIITAVYRCFMEKDASLIEINPLIVSSSGDLLCLDAKMNFDSSSLFRHPDILELRDEMEEDPKEREAAKHELNYIALDGNIGCMVNGAGLAMATMDIIKLTGGAPANFLDVGGTADKERITEAFKLILSDPNVEGILINIFGGIVRCDMIADGVVAAAKEVKLNVPLVVRLEGTNVEAGKKILNESGFDIEQADNLGDAAQKIVRMLKDIK